MIGFFCNFLEKLLKIGTDQPRPTPLSIRPRPFHLQRAFFESIRLLFKYIRTEVNAVYEYAIQFFDAQFCGELADHFASLGYVGSE